MTPLRQRFIDDLRLRNFSEGTIRVYVHAVERFAKFLGRSPVDATAEEVRQFLLIEMDRGVSRSYCVIQRNALRHLLEQTLGRCPARFGAHTVRTSTQSDRLSERLSKSCQHMYNARGT